MITKKNTKQALKSWAGMSKNHEFDIKVWEKKIPMFSVRPARFVPFLRNWISYNSVNYKYLSNSMPFLLWLQGFRLQQDVLEAY